MRKLHHLDAKDLRFTVFSAKNVRELSVSKIVTPLIFDQLGHPLPGGLYDLKMGNTMPASYLELIYIFEVLTMFSFRSIFDCFGSLCNLF